MEIISTPIALKRTRFLARDVEKYEEEQKEAWKQEYEKAQVCFDIQETVIDGNRIYEVIIRIDEWWRLMVYRSPELYVTEFDAEIENLLSRWLVNSLELLKLYGQMENEYVSREFDIAQVDQLKKYVSECSSLLRPISTLPDEMSSMRDAAEVAHQSGETVEMGSFRD